MADEGNIQHPIDSVKRKRSRHWDLEEALLTGGAKKLL